MEVTLDSDGGEVALGSSGVGWHQAHGCIDMEVALGRSDVGWRTMRTHGGTTAGSDLDLTGLDLGSIFFIVEI
jgi:hypothetical protein